MLCQWTERRDRREDAAPELFRIRRIEILSGDQPSDQLVNPLLVFDPEAGSVAAGELDRKLRFDTSANHVFDTRHSVHGVSATWIAWSVVETADSVPPDEPGSAITAARCNTAPA